MGLALLFLLLGGSSIARADLVGGSFFKTPQASELGASVGSISLSVFDSFSGWLYIVCGLFVGWYIIESIMLLFFVYSKEEREKRKNKKE